MPHKPLWTGADVALACGGKLFGESLALEHVSIDTRTLKPGSLFVAIIGPKADGHAYLQEAVAQGARTFIVSDAKAVPDGVPYVLVKETQEALIQLGMAARQRSIARIIGVTGSYGKTGVKDALMLLLGQQGIVSGTERSFNNHWGTPLTLARLGEDVDYGVFEMGMNNPGEMTQLTSWVQPEVALITNIAGAHVGNFKSLEDIAYAKAEIMKSMQAGSAIVLNKDGGFYDLLKSTAHKYNLRVISFGVETPGDFHLIHATETETGYHLQVRTPVGDLAFDLPMIGSHWIANALGVLAVVYAAGADVVQAARDFPKVTLGAGRGEMRSLQTSHGHITVIDESYNAGPASMEAAINVLGRKYPTAQGRRIAILGDMLELGSDAERYHLHLKEVLVRNHVDKVYCSGPMMTKLYESLPQGMRGGCDLDVQNLTQGIVSDLQNGDILMVKGSRGQRAYEGRMAYVVKSIYALVHSPDHQVGHTIKQGGQA